MKHITWVIAILLMVASANARIRTTQKQLHSNAAPVQVLEETDARDDITADVNPDGIIMRGFSKRASDSKESFFLTSRLTHRISCVRLLMRYTAMDGSLLHERRVAVPVDLRPGETRLVSVKSFDVQRMFYYYGGNKPRKNATPFKIAYRLVGYDIPVGD